MGDTWRCHKLFFRRDTNVDSIVVLSQSVKPLGHAVLMHMFKNSWKISRMRCVLSSPNSLLDEV